MRYSILSVSNILSTDKQTEKASDIVSMEE